MRVNSRRLYLIKQWKTNVSSDPPISAFVNWTKEMAIREIFIVLRIVGVTSRCLIGAGRGIRTPVDPLCRRTLKQLSQRPSLFRNCRDGLWFLFRPCSTCNVYILVYNIVNIGVYDEHCHRRPSPKGGQGGAGQAGGGLLRGGQAAVL